MRSSAVFLKKTAPCNLFNYTTRTPDPVSMRLCHYRRALTARCAPGGSSSLRITESGNSPVTESKTIAQCEVRGSDAILGRHLLRSRHTWGRCETCLHACTKYPRDQAQSTQAPIHLSGMCPVYTLEPPHPLPLERRKKRPEEGGLVGATLQIINNLPQ